MLRPLSRLLAVCALSLISACGGDTGVTNDVERIVSTTSFGMCVGYCRTSLEITPGEAVLTREPGGRGAPTLQPQRLTVTLTNAEWKQLATLAASTTFEGLPETIGCPDCADGGAESLAVSRGGKERRVTFDHGADIKQLQPLLTRVRELRMRLMPKEQ
jgi:hypothetical protein